MLNPLVHRRPAHVLLRAPGTHYCNIFLPLFPVFRSTSSVSGIEGCPLLQRPRTIGSSGNIACEIRNREPRSESSLSFTYCQSRPWMYVVNPQSVRRFRGASPDHLLLCIPLGACLIDLISGGLQVDVCFNNLHKVRRSLAPE